MSNSKRIELDVDENIGVARTPPSRLYHDPQWFESVTERVLARTWHLFPGVTPRASGEQVPWTLLEGSLREPLLLTRDDTSLRCMSNVCTHRGTTLVDRPCQGATIRCRYHGRRFDLRGKMSHMPRFEGVESFPAESDDLPQVSLETWGPLAWASLDPAHRGGDLLAPVRERLPFLDLDAMELLPDASRTYEFDANWALYCDNYLEGFHIPFVHPGLVKALDYGGYRTELLPLGTLQVGTVDEGQPAFDLPPGHPDQGRRIGAYYYFLFPTTMLNIYPWGVSVNCVIPLGPTRTRVHFFSLVSNPDLLEAGAGAGLHQVELEDEEVVLACQRGVRSRLYDRGRYSVSEERGTHHFHRLLASML